jgi:tight adherence protein B
VRAVAACWEVAHGSGAGLAASLSALADASRESERVRRDLRAGLAEPRATAVVLAGLPVVGLGLGAGLGADPFAWLLGTGAGVVVLALGILLEVVGVAWSWRIVSSLEADL